MHWKSVLSTAESLTEALEECLVRLQPWPHPADLVSVFLHSSLRHEAATIHEAVTKRLGRPGLLFGCTGGGIIGAAREIELSPALSLTVAHLPDVQLQGFHLRQELPSPDAPPEEWHRLLRLDSGGENPAFLLLADAFEFELEAFLRGLDYAFPHSPKIGGIASDARQPGGNRLLLDDQVYSSGLVGVALEGRVRVTPVVAQGCRPIGKPLTITRGERNLIFEMEGKPPLKVLEETIRGLDRTDRSLAENSLFLGIARDGELTVHSILRNEPNKSKEFLIRNLIGLDSKKGALVVGARVRTGQTVQFHLRDAQASAQDLHKMLDRFEASGASPKGALLFSCLGRGEYLYKKPNHDSGEFMRRFPQATLGGFFCNGEIGPVGSTTFLHGYTSCFAMIEPDSGARNDPP